MKTISIKCSEQYYNALIKTAKVGNATLAECIRGCIEEGAGKWMRKEREKRVSADKEAEVVLPILQGNTGNTTRE